MTGAALGPEGGEVRPHPLLRVGIVFPLELVQLQVPAPQGPEEIPHGKIRGHFHIDIHGPGVALELVVHPVQQGHHAEDGSASQGGSKVEADPQRQPHPGGGPQSGGGGQALDLAAAGDDDGARPQKANTADHLRPHPHRIAGAGGLVDELVC